jgi:ABC-2 type transport system ATP-binding protein
MHRQVESGLMALALEFAGIAKNYRSWPGGGCVEALSEFSLGIEGGEIFGFLGANGAGKTTAIHLAMGFLRPSSGSGRMLGQPFGDAATRRRVGFLAEVVAFCNTSVREAVRFYGGLSGMRRKELEPAAGQALAAVNLETESNRKVSQLSRGMLQRLGLAQALVNDADLLILDEPTSALDPAARVAVRELLLKIRNSGKTIFLSSHLLSEVELVCDRVGVLHRGRLVRVGRLGDLLEARDQLEVVARGVAPDMFAGASLQGSLLHVKIAATEQRAAIERIWSAGGEVVSVNPVRRSLEELFLELTAPKSGHRAIG